MQRASVLVDGTGCGHHIVFVVFAIRQDDHHARGFAAVVESLPAGFHGTSHSRSLRGDHAWVDRFQEQVEGVHVCGEGALHVGLPGKDHKAESVARGGGREALDGAFGQIQPRHAHILGHHAVADVQGDHHVDPFGFHFLQATSHFGVKPSNDEEGKRHAQEEELPGGYKHAVSRQHAVDLSRIRERPNHLVPPAKVAQHQQGEQRGHHQDRGQLHAVQGQAGDECRCGEPSRQHSHPEEEFQKQQQPQNGSKRSPCFHSATDLNRVVRMRNSSMRDTNAMRIQPAEASDFRWYFKTLNSVFSKVSISR